MGAMRHSAKNRTRPEASQEQEELLLLKLSEHLQLPVPPLSIWRAGADVLSDPTVFRV